MGAIMLKYVQLLCFAFFMNNSNCDQLVDIDTVEKKLFSATAKCLQDNPLLDVQTCYENSKKLPENVINNIQLHHEIPKDSIDFHLYCRDAQKLMIQIDHDIIEKQNENENNETYVYMLIAKESTGKFEDLLRIGSGEKLINVNVDDLSTKEHTTLSYNITAYIISSNASVWELKTKKFTTLMDDYQPENITKNEIYLKSKRKYYDDVEGYVMDLTVGWTPKRDQTCSYEIIIFSDYLDFVTTAVPVEKLYEYTFEKLKINDLYNVAVQGVNTHNPRYHSHIDWVEFDFRTHFFFTYANSQHVSDNIFNINVTWTKPPEEPAYYEIQIKDRDADLESSVGIYTANVSGDAKWYYFKGIQLNSSDYLLKVTCFDKTGGFIDSHNGNQDLIRKPSSKLMYKLFYASAVLIALLIIVLYKIWKGRIDIFISLFAQKRIDDMDIEAVKCMSKGTVVDLIADLTKDETMEVEKENITILEQLGEGAFGLVKKGLMIKNGEKQHVAVKMIKNTSNLDDIKQFHQEITVMKSVGQHENIVSIVGHCTSELKYLMLLTEYCDDGNLLDVLRAEFKKQLKFYDTQGKFSSFKITMEKYPDSLLNFDMSESDKKEISYKNIGCSEIQHNLFVINQMYDELNNNNTSTNSDGQVLKGSGMTATNALYLKLNNDTTNSATIIELSSMKKKMEDEVNLADDFLTSSDLLTFAKQICDGMDFLSRKKVVHRDLAARNILVCSNKTVKISDFGLSRDIYQDNFYRKIGNGKLPIKWLALESMTHQVYTSQSDVWSFGILLYEIVTLGAVPYSSISVENILKVLETGYRMERPNHCHSMLYELMMLCWHANPMDRPSFEELSVKLHDFLNIKNAWGEEIIDLQSMFNRCMSETNYMKPLM